jgi:vesicular inhibitory amino acid transporter
MSRAERTDEDLDNEPVYGSLRIPAAAPSSYDYGQLDRGSLTAESEIGGRQRYMTSVVDNQTVS